MLITII